MGRRHSPENCQAAVDEWRIRLLAVAWDKRGRGTAQLLAATLGINSATAVATRGKPLRDAAVPLHRAILAVADGTARPDALDEWIDQHLLRRGGELLISDVQRRTVLTRARDFRRRRAHAERGLRSARIELSEKSWAKLKSIRDELARTYGKVTLGWALERIIAAHGAAQPTAPPKKDKGRKSADQPRGGDLFGAA